MRILALDVLRRSAEKLGIRKRRFATLTRTARLLVTASLLPPVFGAGCGTSNNENSGDGGALADANPLPDREDATSQACVPTTCTGQGISCGPAGNGCGGALQCGECTAPATCGGGGHSSVCGTGGSPCVPKTCGGLGYNCGPVGDGCGGSLSCGDCTAPQTCGGGGDSSVCGSSASDGDASPGDASTTDTGKPPTDSGSGGTFDYYISTTGSDSGPGTLAAPWAITSLMNRPINANNKANYAKTTGQRIGFLPGTYNVSGQMQPDSYSGAIQIDGGTPANPTYYGSSGSNGHYSIGTATISALTAGAAYGGGLDWPDNGPVLAHTESTLHDTGYIVIDGLRFTGYSYKGVRIGGASAGDGPTVAGSVLVTNCEFFGQGQNAGEGEDNYVSLWLDGLKGGGPYTATNNYFHDNYGQDLQGEEHLVAIQVWQSYGVQITYNTVVTSGSFHGKVDDIQGSTIAYNYIDNTKFTAIGGSRCLEDWTGETTSGLTQTTNIHHNVFVWGGWGVAAAGTLNYQAWTTPVNIYNNTLVAVNGGPYPSIWVAGSPSNAEKIQVYNNITTGSDDGSGYKTFRTSPKAIGIWDYNGYMSAASWALTSDAAGTNGGGTTLATYGSATAFAAGVVSNGGISGCESHSVNNSSPQFTGTGTLAQQYRLQEASPFKGVGSSNGTFSGSPCDMGAWGGASPPTQIGSNFE